MIIQWHGRIVMGKHRDRDETDLVFRKFLRDKTLRERETRGKITNGMTDGMLGQGKLKVEAGSVEFSRSRDIARFRDRPAQNSRFDLCNGLSPRDIPVSVSLAARVSDWREKVSNKRSKRSTL